MRIAFVVNQFPCLSETFILRQITGLLDRGHEVDIFAFSAGDDPVQHADVAQYGLLNRTTYFDACACSLPAPIRFLKRLGLIFTHFHKHPRAVLRALNIARFGKSGLFLQVLCQITPFLGKGPYDVLHCQFGNLGEVGLLLKDTGVLGGKVVTSFRGYDISSHVKAYGPHVYKKLFAHGDLFLCVSNRIRDRLIGLGCEERKVLVHRSGIDPSTCDLQPSCPTVEESTKILSVARLVEKKGIEYAIRAVAQILPREPKLKYQIVGDGPLRRHLTGLIRELRVGDQIKILGWKTEREVTALVQQADIVLVPSVTSKSGDEEGIPGVIMEAFAHCVPVVATNHAGIPEIVCHGESGFLVAEKDVDGLAQTLEYLIRRPKLRLIMGRNGHRFVEQHYNIHQLNDRLVDVYQELLADRLFQRYDPAAHAAPVRQFSRATVGQ